MRLRHVKELILCYKAKFQIPISLHPDGVNLWYLKLRISDQTDKYLRQFRIPKVYNIGMQRYSLWKSLNLIIKIYLHCTSILHWSSMLRFGMRMFLALQIRNSPWSALSALYCTTRLCIRPDTFPSLLYTLTLNNSYRIQESQEARSNLIFFSSKNILNAKI